MKVILFASQKGGSSKTTLCRCVAVAADQAGVGSVGMITATRKAPDEMVEAPRCADTELAPAALDQGRLGSDA